MGSDDYVIGIDCSTTATKAVVWDARGNAVAEGRATFDLYSPHPDWGEQNAEDWWESTRTALRRATQLVDTRLVRATGITRQRETESTCLGAGMLAVAASGMYGGVKEAAEAMSGTSARYEPDDERSERYDRLYGVYEEIYPSLQHLFPKLAEAVK